MGRLTDLPINVATPDGSNFSFPDGTPEAVIKNALNKHFGRGPNPPPAGFVLDRPPAGGDAWDQFPKVAPAPASTRGGMFDDLIPKNKDWRSDPVAATPARASNNWWQS